VVNASIGDTQVSSLSQAKITNLTSDLASKLSANQNITVSGDATGSGATSITLTLANSGVTAGSYTNANITVDAKGRVTSATNGISGEGISISTVTSDLLGNTNNFYINKKTGSQLELTLPATSSINDEFGFASATSFGVVLKQAAFQYIQNENNTTDVGITDGIQSTEIGTAARLVCIEANRGWLVYSKLGNISNLSAITYDEDALNVVTAIELTGTTLTNAQKMAINNRIINAKSDGVWSKWVAYYGFVGGTAAAHAINWKAIGTYNIIWSGTLTHDNNGVKGNGSTGYGNTGLNPLDVFSTGNVGLGFYLTENKVSAPTFEIASVVTSPSPIKYCELEIYDNLGYFDVWSNSLGSPAITGTKQYFSGNKIGTTSKIFKNGAVTNTATGITGALPSQNLIILARNRDGSVESGSYSTARLGSAVINTGLTDAEETANYISELAFQTTLGRN
jgi:hypothetical protein